MVNKNWEEHRTGVDQAIRAGMSKQEWCDENDISRGLWYSMKPKGFKWNAIQNELGIKKNKVKRREKIDEVEIPQERHCKVCVNIHFSEGLCVYCKIILLKSLMDLYRQGFTDDDVREVLGE